MARVHVGLSGYSYKPWQGPGRFYPASLKSNEFLHYYSTRYDAVEMDGTWYRMPTEKSVQAWLEQTPAKFFFCPKVHRQVTHQYRLKPEALPPLQFFLEQLSPLGPAGRLGPILIQLPPNFRRDDERLDLFLDRLPGAARWAVEFRHESWKTAEVEAILSKHGVAWVAADTDEAPAERRHTAAFCYARLRRSAYDDAQLRDWAAWFGEASGRGRDSFAFFKHEDEGSPWVFADSLRALL